MIIGPKQIQRVRFPVPKPGYTEAVPNVPLPMLPRLEGQLGVSAEVSPDRSKQTIIDCKTDDGVSRLMNVTLFAENTLEDGDEIPEGMLVAAEVQFGQGGVQSNPVDVSVGNGITFTVPGSSLKVMGKVIGADPGTSAIKMGGFVTLDPFPRAPNNIPPLSPQLPISLAVGASTNADPMEVPDFASAMRLEFFEYETERILIEQWDGATNVISSFIREPSTYMPWLPIMPTARFLVFFNEGAAAATIYPVIGLEF